ncbi:Protein FAR1-RELATED SEQUENCE 7 [Frankliniella fusca]|uniref:Protein FAR1-RELATED SEQUENCE 7 n=1 Tax=Frankliniella fusca TaxID=407009 RepID=A0AAE1LJS7_9NEOP|nr:Protein FAR1-RELATED SEQUENCE 7 [Frankliniella fusca]
MLRDKLEEIRQRDPDASLHIETDSVTGEVLFIFIQTSDMRENLKKFPEVLLMDTTYMINENRMPVSVIDVMDGEGEGLVVGYAFLSNESQDTLCSMLSYFVKVSGESIFDRTECCVVDKDFSEIAAIKEVLPNVAVHICSVHTEKNFKKLAKGQPNKKECIELMKALIYCDSQEKFDETYNNLRSIAASEMMQTFDKNWLKCQEAWSLKDKILVMNLKNNSTNRVERHNRLLKTVFNVNTALYEAVEGIVNIILANKKDDRLYKMHETLTKKTDINTCSDPIVEVICNDLTDYAAKIVCEQLLLSRKPSPLPFLYKPNETCCTCTLFKYFKLPCRHIMRYLRQQDLPLYTKEHIPQRWWKEYNFVNDAANEADVIPTQLKALNQRIQAKLPGEALYDVLKPAEMYKKLIPLLPKLKTAVLSSGTRIFYLRYQVLVDLLDAWNMGTEVASVHVNPAQIEDVNLQSLEVVTDHPSKEGVSQTANFHLNKVVVKGKPSGVGETIHDGTKKTRTSRKRKMVRKAVGKNCCCVCGNEAGSHRCQICGETVHSIPPCGVPAPGVEEGYGMLCICKHCQDVSKSSEDDDCLEIDSENLSQVPTAECNTMGNDPDNLIESSDSQPTNEWPDFRLAVVRTKGRQKNKAKGPSKWNFTSLADTATTCCICDKKVDIDHKCFQCRNTVHATHPCSKKKSDGCLVCNHCEGSQDTSLSSKDYVCFGCGKLLSLRLVKSGKFAGRPFYGCDKGTPKCNYFKFWKSNSTMPSQKEKRQDVTKPHEHQLQTPSGSAFGSDEDEDDRILSECASAVEDKLGITMSAGLQLPPNTSGSTERCMTLKWGQCSVQGVLNQVVDSFIVALTFQIMLINNF